MAQDGSLPGSCLRSRQGRFLTHLKSLKDPALLLICSSRASSTSDHLGPVLIQLPPGWKLNVQRLPELLECLPKKVRHFAIEFRDLSWYSHTVYWLLGRRNVVLSIHNWRNENWPQRLTADFAYLRVHGVNGPLSRELP